MAKFLKDLEVGKNGQQIFIDKLNEIENIKDISTNNTKTFDVSCNYNNKIYTFEIKFDLMASKTGNIAIEYFNPKTNKPSGIMATEALFWVCILKDPFEIYISRTSILKNFLDKFEPCRIINCGGDKNSAMMLYKKERILTECFTKINNKTDIIDIFNEIPC
jgi:hypothetical protein